MPLSADDALTAKTLLWEDLAEQIRANRQGEVDAKRIVLDGFTLDYETVLLGQEPADGRSLFISMHGGGSAPKETNDQQWQNQIQLAESYAPKDALWIAPRAPTDDWNMWFKDHIIPIFDQLISNMIVLEGIHPDKVYLTGYSAGGDGVYQLGPTMADRWAGAAMSAGHPNDMTPLKSAQRRFCHSRGWRRHRLRSQSGRRGLGGAACGSADGRPGGLPPSGGSPPGAPPLDELG